MILRNGRSILEHKPPWLEEVPKLPKGYKWSDENAEKFSHKGGTKARVERESYVFLPIGNDLYIKDLLNHTYGYAYKDKDGNVLPNNRITRNDTTLESCMVHVSNHTICVIRNWKSLFASEVIMGLDEIMTPLLETAILTVWKDHGARLGYTFPILRDLN